MLEHYTDELRYRCIYSDSSADSNALNVIIHVDNKRPIFSTFVTPFYREFSNQDFIHMCYNGIKKEANYDYNRYWHGYSIIVRPLLLVMTLNQIKVLLFVGYLILTGYFLYLLMKEKHKYFSIAFILMNIFYIVPYGFNSIEYISIFYIYLLSCIGVLKKHKYVFICSGVLTAFFDFWTAETLTLTVPLLLYLYLNQKEIKIKEVFKNIGMWLFGYCFTFGYKWVLTSILFQKNYIKIAIEKYLTHTKLVTARIAVESNISTLFFDKLDYGTISMIYFVVLLVLLIIVYLFHKKGAGKYLFCIVGTCFIPYVRYFVLAGHSFEFTSFTYRAQLAVIVGIVLLITNIDIKLLKRKE